MMMKMVRNIIKREEKVIMKKIPLHRVDEKKNLHFSALFTILLLVERRKIMMEKIFLYAIRRNMQKNFLIHSGRKIFHLDSTF